MGFNFRKSIKIAPGIKLNITKKGVSSVSVGGRGAKVNIGKKGTKTTLGLPGTGISHTSYKAHNKTHIQHNREQSSYQHEPVETKKSITKGFIKALFVIFLIYIAYTIFK